jgi:nucleotide-binding universal stress UspA family protein
MRTILVPTDFSGYSNNALDFAYHAAQKADAEIVLIHVIESMDAQSYNTMGMVETDSQINLYMNELMKTIRARMDQLVNDPKYAGVEIKTHVHYGKPYETIAESITRHQADLVVMGTLGSSGLDELFIGSNTEKVVRFSKCPVLAIPDEAKYAHVNDIVYATNLEANELQVLAALKTIQKMIDAHIHLLWVNTPHVLSRDESMEDKLEEYASKHGLENYSVHVVKAIFAEAGIMNYADKIDAGMIALATGGRKGLAYLFSGSLAEDIVNHSARPVWTYNVG